MNPFKNFPNALAQYELMLIKIKLLKTYYLIILLTNQRHATMWCWLAGRQQKMSYEKMLRI